MKSEREGGVWNIRLPEPASPLRPSHLQSPPTWIEFLREIEEEWVRYMREDDTPEERFAAKNPARFVLK